MSDKKISKSQEIAQRLTEAGVQFYSGDNISQHLLEGEREILMQEVETHFEALLKALVIDTTNDHNTEGTAKRVAKMFVNEVFAGRYDPPPTVTSFPKLNYDGLYVEGPIAIYSTCAHHFQNIIGHCWIGLLPEEEVIGLSKFTRLVRHITRRPSIQEEMTVKIADVISEYTKSEHVAVLIKAQHFCMACRGVMEPHANFMTPIMRGDFRSSTALREEFYQLVKLSQREF